MVDISWVDLFIRQYATPVVGAALILAGIFLRLLGKGVAYLVLGVGIMGTLYIVLSGLGKASVPWLVPAVFLAGIAGSVMLALALRALTVAFEFGFFSVGLYLILQAVPSFAPWFPSVSTVPGASTWMLSSILTTVAGEWFARRFMPTRRLAVTSAAGLATAIHGARR